jgi:hypothetical protein
MRFRFTDDQRVRFPARIMCAMLEVSPSGCHAWRDQPESARTIADCGLVADIRRIHVTGLH